MYDQIEHIMATFDFEKVHQHMVESDWRWRGEIPDVKEIRAWAEYLLMEAAFSTKHISTGGLNAVRIDGKNGTYLELTFVLAEKNSADIARRNRQ